LIKESEQPVNKSKTAIATLITSSLSIVAQPIDKPLATILLALAVAGCFFFIGSHIRTNNYIVKAIKDDNPDKSKDRLLLDMVVSKAKNEDEAVLHVIAVFSKAMKKHGTPNVSQKRDGSVMVWGNGTTAKIFTPKRMNLIELIINNIQDTYSE
jgi:hypothetical protein